MVRWAEEARAAAAMCVCACALPALFLSYLAVRCSKAAWLRAARARRPGLRWVRADTVRALLDTPRNQGIINVLLRLPGVADVEQIRAALETHVVERRVGGGGEGPEGELMFPRMRQRLVTAWGAYAWEPAHAFRLQDHFIVARGVYRGRPVTDHNIQDYVSDIISKYFPHKQPPWQYFVIPCASPEPKHYILVRVHHMLLTGADSITIGDLLMLQQEPHAPHASPPDSPLVHLLPTPTAIPRLWTNINETVSSCWNDFVSELDPRGGARAPGALHAAALLALATARAAGSGALHLAVTEPLLTAQKIITAFRLECKKLNLTIYKVLTSPLVSADPRSWARGVGRAARAWARATGAVRDVAREARGAGREVRAALAAAWRAPLHLWRDTVGANDGETHLLQQVSLCGRKVAAWSEGVEVARVTMAARRAGVPAGALLLAAAARALPALFVALGARAPRAALLTARAHPHDFLFAFAEGGGKRYKKALTGGMVCLRLPLQADPVTVARVVSAAGARQAALAAAWAAQAQCGLLTRALPSPLARLALNALSRRFALSYAEVAPPSSGAPRARRTLWGAPVDAVIYWRPPQANISVSLTVIQYGGRAWLGVMADARLSPGHAAAAAAWAPRLRALLSLLADDDADALHSSGTESVAH